MTAPRPARRPGWSRATALPLAGLAAGVAYTFGALRYPFGTLVAPGPGLFPVLVGLVIVAASAVGLVAEARAPSLGSAPLGPAAWRIPALVLALAAYAVILKPVGFLLTSTLLAALVLAVLGRRPLRVVLAISAAISVGAAVLFRLLGVPLPGGLLSVG